MNSFISEIRKINTNKLIYYLSNKSIEMYMKKQPTIDVETIINHFGQQKKMYVTLTAWDILNIEFLSVKESNDYRHGKKPCSFGALIDLYRKYEAEIDEQNITSENIFRVLVGMTAEQFQYQELYLLFEKYNRDHYILLSNKDFFQDTNIDVNAIISDIFGYSAEDYTIILLTVFWLCSKYPEPLSVPECIYRKKADSVLTKENITSFVKYYSCTYDELRNSKISKQLLYSKPFIKTDQHSAYIASSLFLIMMLLANGIYWIVRDYYRKKNSQEFVNAFGQLFEGYIENLASLYCENTEWKKISPSHRKGADYIFHFASFHMIFEAKTSLLAIDAKQQNPNLDSLEIFYKRTIRESYEQLQSSYQQIVPTLAEPVLKIILLYDQFSNTAVIEAANPDIFEQDRNCYIMTIRDLEILLYYHCHQPIILKKILNDILEQINGKKPRRSINMIYQNESIYQNPHFKGELNYLSKIRDYLKRQFE